MAFASGTMPAGFGDADRRASPSGRAASRRFDIEPPKDREEAFARARRRSAWVRFLRKALLLGTVTAVALMAWIAVFDPFSVKIGPLSFSSLSLSGSKIAMERPKLAGFRGDGQPYSMTAERALQDIKNPTVVELQKVVGEIGNASGAATHVTADSGIYDSVNSRMKLMDNIRIANANLEIFLRTADIDFKTGVYVSDEPVEVHVGEGTTISADRAAARHNGQELTFEGRVRTKVVSQQDDQSTDAGAKGAKP